MSAILISLRRSLLEEGSVTASSVCPLGIGWDGKRAPSTMPGTKQ